MTVENITPLVRLGYIGPGQYDFDFPIPEETDLQVSYIDTAGVVTLLERITDYTVVKNVGTDGGHVDTISPLSVTGYIEIRRVVQPVQGTDWEAEGYLKLDQIELSFDKLVMLIQQIYTIVNEGSAASNWKGAWLTATLYDIKDIIQVANGSLYYCVTGHTSGVFATDLAAGKWRIVFDTTLVTVPQAAAEAAKVAAEAAKVAAEAAKVAAELAETNAETAEANAETAAASAELAISNSKTVVSSDASLSVIYSASEIDIKFNKDLTKVVHNDIIGGDITVSGSTLTITPCGCWNSTRTIWLETTVNKTLVLPSGAGTENGLWLIAQVRLVVDGSITFKYYADLAAIAADVTINTSRVIDFWQNNSAGTAAKAGYSKNGTHWNLKASESAVNSLAIVPSGCNTAINMNAFLPPAEFVDEIMPGAQGATAPQQLVFGVDGTNAIVGVGSGDTLNGDGQLYAWNNHQGTSIFIPVQNNTLYWGLGGNSSSGTHKALIRAVKLRR